MTAESNALVVICYTCQHDLRHVSRKLSAGKADQPVSLLPRAAFIGARVQYDHDALSRIVRDLVEDGFHASAREQFGEQLVKLGLNLLSEGVAMK